MSAFTMKVSLTKANPIQMNTFGARSLPAARSVQAYRDTLPVPGPVAQEEEQEWMTS